MLSYERNLQMGRSEKSVINAFSSIVGQLLNNMLRFVCRTAFIYTLGKEYLGISSLYANILTILSVSELGFSTVITYSLYQPLADENIPLIQSLMTFFKKAYQVIGLLILTGGIAIMPLLPKLMQGTTDKVNIYLYYLLYLAQTVISYVFFAYKGTLLIADQKKYLYDAAVYIVQIIMNLLQLAVLFVFRSFLIYTLIAVFCDAMQNVATAVIADKKYPFLKQKGPKLDKERKKEVFKQVYATSLYHICTTIGTSTDNLIISSNISVLMVGLYDNYAMIIQVVHKLLQGVFQAFTSSLGNLYATESKKRNEFIFRCLDLLDRWILILCSVCFIVLFQPFITLWIGRDYLLDERTVLVIALNFASLYLQMIVQIYKTAAGLFVYGKYRPVVSAVLNLGISILLVKPLGLCGVILGSIISRTVTTWWFDAWILYRRGFEMSPASYFFNCGIGIALLLIIAAVIQLICRVFPVITWGSLMMEGLICFVTCNLMLWAVYGRGEEFAFIKDKAVGMIQSKTIRRKK